MTGRRAERARRSLGAAIVAALATAATLGLVSLLNAPAESAPPAAAWMPAVPLRLAQVPAPPQASDAASPRGPKALPSRGLTEPDPAPPALPGPGLDAPALPEATGPGASAVPASISDLLGSVEPPDGLVMTEATVDEPPTVVERAAPIYPRRARTQGIEGQVVVGLLVGVGGEVEAVKVLESAPAGLFEEAAVAAVQRWRFRPGRYDGREVKVWVRQVLHFDLR